jgi:hypothetical protein
MSVLARAREINEEFVQSDETSLHAKAQHPRGQNPFCAIFVGGPHLSRSAADKTLKRLQSNRDLLAPDRDLARHIIGPDADATIKPYTLHQALPF